MIIEVKVPGLPPSVAEASLSWRKKVGDRVSMGESLADLEFDDKVVRMTAMASGTLQKFMVNSHTIVKPGQVVAILQGTMAPLPGIEEILTLPLTSVEYYYLLRRMAATLTVWNARNLNIPSAPVLIEIKDLNPLYRAWHRNCCLVVAPVDLFDPNRTDWHAIQAAHALVFHAIQTLKWDKLELTGLDTMVSRALVTTILLGVTALRCHITEKEKKIVEALRQSPPGWLKPSQAPGQIVG